MTLPLFDAWFNNTCLILDQAKAIQQQMSPPPPLDLSAASEPPADSPTPAVSGRLLVVDDEIAIVHALKGLLEYQGYEVVTASGGQEALEQFRLEPDGFDAAELVRVLDGLLAQRQPPQN